MIDSFYKSIAIHSVVVGLLALVFYSRSKPQESKLNFTVIEKIKKVSTTVAPVEVKKVKPKKIKPNKRKVFGVSRKSVTNETSTASVKLGNTVAKEVDDKKLNKDDEDSLPIPAEEYLITAMPSVELEVRPQYPPEARKQGIQGSVIFEILIDPTGKVRQAVLIKGLREDMTEAARKAMLQFKFRPAKINQQQVAVKIKYAINFVLEE